MTTSLVLGKTGLARTLYGVLTGFFPLCVALAADFSTPRPCPSLVPPMGWNSWYRYYDRLAETNVLEQMYFAATNGLAQLGYQWLSIDDGWQASARDADGDLWWATNKYPRGLVWLAEQARTNGQHLGIYTEPRAKTSAGYPGTDLPYLEKDALLWSSWGVEYVKFDFNAAIPSSDPGAEISRFAYTWDQTARPLYLHMSIYDGFQPWAPYLLNELRRPNPDYHGWTADALWDHLQRHVWFNVTQLQYVRPGFYPSMDITTPNLADPSFGPDNNLIVRAYFSMGALMCSPRILDSYEASAPGSPGWSYMTNRICIRILQDPLVRPASVLTNQVNPNLSCWSRRLCNQQIAVALYNQGDTLSGYTNATVNWSEIGLPPGQEMAVFNVWSNTLSFTTNSYSVPVGPRSAELLLLTPAAPPLTIATAASGPRITVGSVPGITYQLQSRTNLTVDFWRNTNPPQAGNGEPLSFDLTGGEPAQFFRMEARLGD